MYQMFHTRHALHRKAYQHKVVQAVEIMLVYEGLYGWKIRLHYMSVLVDGKTDVSV